MSRSPEGSDGSPCWLRDYAPPERRYGPYPGTGLIGFGQNPVSAELMTASYGQLRPFLAGLARSDRWRARDGSGQINQAGQGQFLSITADDRLTPMRYSKRDYLV